MRLTAVRILPLVSFPAFTLAHTGHHHHRAVAAFGKIASTHSSSAPHSTTGASVASARTSLSTTIPAGTVPVTLLSTNPTAVPLAFIGTTVPSAPTMAIPHPSPGTKPRGIPNAPGIPDGEPFVHPCFSGKNPTFASFYVGRFQISSSG